MPTHGLVVTGAYGKTDEKDGDESEGDAGGEGGAEVDAHLRHRTGDEREHAQHQADDAGEREDAVAGEFDFQHHEDGGGQQQHDSGVVDGQQIEREEREQYQQGAERSGDDGAGRVELEIDEQTADDQHEDGEVRIHQPVEHTIAQRRGHGIERRVFGMQHGLGAVHPRDGAAIDLVQQGIACRAR